ncbi:hypothetical protein [Streptomyces sp. AC495_CC817]|uniref:hypothetical protein n=1 Tax=Streptomyces sp. AC495_CC817 TaxID=2823900 RepID=UPI001C26E75E|nr:hypothetical protein [Streptomyces sp. AC495_CC817]
MSDAATRQRHKDQVALGAAAVCAVAAVLIWVLWALPVARSVGEAEPAAIGDTITVELAEGPAGIWGSGRSPLLGTMECTVTGPSGERLAQSGPPSLTWDDTLWWLTPRPGFEQVTRFTAPAAGVYDVACTDALDTYDGSFLVAGDTFGTGTIGLGRTGSSDFAVGTVLAFSAVVLPLFAALVPLIILVRRFVERRRRRRPQQQSG